jgi:acetoin utilization deacetylase AcuC-like enzyme
MTTAIVTDARYLAHNDPVHVECADRLVAINRALDESGLRDELLALAPRAATQSELQAVHSKSHLEAVQHFGEHGGGYLDADTYMNSDSWEAALWAAGGALRAVEAVVQGECQNAFALVRPPGHHATATRAMGFCLVNNIAIAARHALNTLGLERVAIVDYDVHHGNGTQDILYSDPRVLFCSTHASPFYPGTGLLHEIGEGEGHGKTLNVPLPLGVGDKGYEQVFTEVVIPALHTWQPQLLLVSAGYDSHWSDPIGPMVVSVAGFGRLTQMLYAVAADVCDGKMVLLLEGGYSLRALGPCVVAALRVLLGKEPEPDPLGPITAPEPELENLIARLKNGHPLFVSS